MNGVTDIFDGNTKLFPEKVSFFFIPEIRMGLLAGSSSYRIMERNRIKQYDGLGRITMEYDLIQDMFPDYLEEECLLLREAGK